MMLPITFENLSLFFAAIALILLITSGLISSSSERRSILISPKKLRKAAISTSILFMITIALEIFTNFM